MNEAAAGLGAADQQVVRPGIARRVAVRLPPKPQRGRAATRCPCNSGAVCGAIMTACCSASAATRSPSVKPAARVLSNCA